MSKNRDKIARNRIREQYASHYASKLNSKDGQIQALCDKIDELNGRIRQLAGQNQELQEALQAKDLLIQELRRCSKLSDQELELLKTDMARRENLAKSGRDFFSMMTALSRPLSGTPGPLPLYSATWDSIASIAPAEIHESED